MGEHINTKHNGTKRHKKGFNESQDVRAQRAARVSFKTYMQNLEDDLLEQEMFESDWVVERGTRVGDEYMWTEVDTFPTEDEANEEVARLEKGEKYDGDTFRVREV